jgi:hypothetical protein
VKIDFLKLNISEFNSSFETEEQCLKYLADTKWSDGYTCKKCGNKNYCKGKTPYSRRCTRCKHDESATAHTVFHKCKIPIKDAFAMAYEVCNIPEITISKLSEEFDRRKMTCWRFKKKIMECLELNQTAKL